MVHATQWQTISDPTRLQILEVLRNGERSVSEIVERLSIDQSGVSRHLRILQEAGFVQARPDGQKRFYSLRPEPFQAMDGWMSQYRHLWEKRLDRFGKALASTRSIPNETQTDRRRKP